MYSRQVRIKSSKKQVNKKKKRKIKYNTENDPLIKTALKTFYSTKKSPSRRFCYPVTSKYV